MVSYAFIGSPVARSGYCQNVHNRMAAKRTMKHPPRLRPRDFRSLYLTVGECKELGADPIAWRRHLIDGMLHLLGAAHGACFEMGCGPEAGPSGVAPSPTIFVDSGTADAGVRRIYQETCLAGMEFSSGALARRTGTDDVIPLGAFTRRQMIDDATWYGSDFTREYSRRTGFDDFVGSRSLAGPATAFSLGVNRASADRPFGRRELRLIRMAVAEVLPLHGTRLAAAGAPSATALPPRLRQVLVRLFDGDGEKQIASRLGISRHTVHEYIRRLHRLFDVSSRGELLARCAPLLPLLRRPGPPGETGNDR